MADTERPTAEGDAGAGTTAPTLQSLGCDWQLEQQRMLEEQRFIAEQQQRKALEARQAPRGDAPPGDESDEFLEEGHVRISSVAFRQETAGVLTYDFGGRVVDFATPAAITRRFFVEEGGGLVSATDQVESDDEPGTFVEVPSPGWFGCVVSFEAAAEESDAAA